MQAHLPFVRPKPRASEATTLDRHCPWGPTTSDILPLHDELKSRPPGLTKFTAPPYRSPAARLAH